MILNLPSLFIPICKHFFKRHAWHWFLCALSTTQRPVPAWHLKIEREKDFCFYLYFNQSIIVKMNAGTFDAYFVIIFEYNSFALFSIFIGHWSKWIAHQINHFSKREIKKIFCQMVCIFVIFFFYPSDTHSYIPMIIWNENYY